VNLVWFVQGEQNCPWVCQMPIVPQAEELEDDPYSRVSHSKHMVDKKTKNHINGIEGFWSFAKYILYNYRRVPKYHFLMYLKEVEYRFNYRGDNLFKLFMNIYFGYTSH